jgi:hypothetical protein
VYYLKHPLWSVWSCVNNSRREQATHSAAVWLLVLGLVLAGLGQAAFSLVREYRALGAVAYTAGFFVFLALARRLRGGRRPTRIELRLIRFLCQINSTAVAQLLLTLLALGAMTLVTLISQSSRPANGYWPAFFVWLFGVAALAVAFVFLPSRSGARGWRAALTRGRAEVLLVLALTLVALGLRTVNLTQVPYPFAGDEGSVGQEGQRILTGTQSNLFITGWQSEASMSFLPWALSMALFGQNIFGLRIFAALVGGLTIPLLYLLLRAMFNRPVAFLGAALLAAMSPHIHFSRIAVNNIENPLFACLVFWLVYRAVETRRVAWFGAAGLTAGLAMYTFVGSRLVLILAGFFLLLAWLGNRSCWKEWPRLVVFGLTAGLVVLPLGVYFWQHPDIGFARMNQIGILQNGWLANETRRMSEPAWLVLGHLSIDSLLAFVSTPAKYGFYNSPGPLFDPLWSLFLILGLIGSLTRIRERRHLLLQMWFWSVIFFGSVLVVPPPSAERLSMAFPAVAALIAWAVWEAVSVLHEFVYARPIVARGLAAAIGTVLAVTSLNFYFNEYTPQHYYADANSEVAQQLGEYLATVSRDTRVYFLGEPRMFYDFPSIAFLSGYLPGVDVPIAPDVRPIVDPAHAALFVALPERESELDEIQTLFPGGAYSETARAIKPEERLYLVYRVDPRGAAP